MNRSLCGPFPLRPCLQSPKGRCAKSSRPLSGEVGGKTFWRSLIGGLEESGRHNWFSCVRLHD